MQQGDLRIGSLSILPGERLLQEGSRKLSLEPLVMRLFLALLDKAGQVVTRRELFTLCWGASPVSDDSLNRLVLSLRKSLAELDTPVAIQTVPGTGYVLKISPPEEAVSAVLSGGAVQAALDSWRLGLPQPDHLRLEQLRAATRQFPDDARLWGWAALLCRHAAEYGLPEEALAFTGECEQAARRALALEPANPEARVALATILPLFREWALTRQRLLQVLADHPDHVVATQDLATLEMATGRITEGKRVRDRLMMDDPLAAVTNYKSVYQHWAVGDLRGMDRVADRAIHLWPTHPAVWLVRLWTHAYSGRYAAALAMTDEAVPRPDVPRPMLTFLRTVLGLSADAAPGIELRIIDTASSFAATGPAAAMASLFALGLVDAVDAQFAILEAYYLQQGAAPVPSRHSAAELALNEQHRRLTQVLFMPVHTAAREDRRFTRLCEQIGLAEYWAQTGLTPDFLGGAAR